MRRRVLGRLNVSWEGTGYENLTVVAPPAVNLRKALGLAGI